MKSEKDGNRWKKKENRRIVKWRIVKWREENEFTEKNVYEVLIIH